MFIVVKYPLKTLLIHWNLRLCHYYLKCKTSCETEHEMDLIAEMSVSFWQPDQLSKLPNKHAGCYPEIFVHRTSFICSVCHSLAYPYCFK